ncbi:MAG TPA: hypothetical protein DCZ10_02040 [Pelotomaculum sp.]|nr:hypothetical protein [Pelotomaculum sp.]
MDSRQDIRGFLENRSRLSLKDHVPCLLYNTSPLLLKVLFQSDHTNKNSRSFSAGNYGPDAISSQSESRI